MSIQPKLEQKLAEWQEAGLITAETAERIRLHEGERHTHQRPYLLYALGSLGALAVASGVVALIASNWDAIAPGTKLGLDLLLVASVSAGIVRADAKASAWIREILLLVQYGIVLASIGLIAQVYHLGGQPYEALLVWSALTLPLMAQSRSLALATIWIIGLKVTLGSVLIELAEERDSEELAAGLAYLAPLACIGIATSERLARARPNLVRALRSFGWAALVIVASLAPLEFYGSRWHWKRLNSGHILAGFGLSAAATAIVCARIGPRGQGGAPTRARVRLVLVAALLASFLPFLIPHDELAVGAALTFIAFWATVGWAGYKLRMLRILNLATAMIGLRILIIYFELFGSLMSTGIALISGGLLTLFITWLWIRKSQDFKRKLAPAEGPTKSPRGRGGEGKPDA